MSHSPGIYGGAGTIQGTIVCPPIVDIDQVLEPSVTPGNMSLRPLIIADDSPVFEPVINGGVPLIAPSIIADVSNVLIPQVQLGVISLVPSLIVDADAVNNHAFTPGPVELLPPIVSDVDTLFEPSVSETSVAVAALDGFANTGAFTPANGGSFTVSAGTNRFLVYVIGEESSSGFEIAGVTYGGQPMTQRVVAQGVSGFPIHIRIFTLGEAGIAAAANTNFVATTSGSGGGQYRAASGSYENVSQTSPIVSAQGQGGNTGSVPSVVLPSVDEGFIVAGFASSQVSDISFAVLNEEVEIDASSETMSVATAATTGANVTVSPTTTAGGGALAAAGITIRPA